MAAKKGRQTPTKTHCLPYKKSFASKAVKLYTASGQKPVPWQKNILRDIMAVNKDGLWTHVICGYAVARRNGKSEDAIMRSLYSLDQGERVLYTAHRTATAHAIWLQMCSILDKSGTAYKSIKAKGSEEIRLETGGVIYFRTRSSLGALGEGFDLVIIDEAQEYTESQRTALAYVCSASPNPQTIMMGTPPTHVSSGTVFTDFRNSCLDGTAEESYWAEWSIESPVPDIRDTKWWYETNPSLGYHLTERNVRSEIGRDEADFMIQRLGLWVSHNQKSAISPPDWDALKLDELPALTGKLFVGIKYAKSDKVAMSIAVRTADGRILVECIDCRDIRSGDYWILDFLREAETEVVVIDGASHQHNLAASMREIGIRKKPVLPTVAEIINANAAFETGIFQGMLCHMGQVSLCQVVYNCDKRALGSNGGFGYKAQRDDLEIALLDSAMLAYWACATVKPKRRQRVSY